MGTWWAGRWCVVYFHTTATPKPLSLSDHFSLKIRYALIPLKESICSIGTAGEAGSIPGQERSPGGGNGKPVQCSCQNSMDRGAWWAIVHRTRLGWLSTHRCSDSHFSNWKHKSIHWKLYMLCHLLGEKNAALYRCKHNSLSCIGLKYLHADLQVLINTYNKTLLLENY